MDVLNETHSEISSSRNDSGPPLYDYTPHAPHASSGDGAVSEQQRLVAIGFLCFLSALGTLGNSIVLCVYLRKRDALVSTHFILVLAFVDLITCLIVIPFTVFMEYSLLMVMNDLLCKCYKFLIASNIPFSAMIMVAIAIDRYLCICHPFVRFLNLTRAKTVTITLTVFAATLGILVALQSGVWHALTEQEFYDLTGQGFDDDVIDTSVLSVNVTGVTAGARHPEVTRRNYSDVEYTIYYTGQCYENHLILGETFFWWCQKLYTTLYALCLVVVCVLYTLIYQSVLARRKRRRRQMSQPSTYESHMHSNRAPVHAPAVCNVAFPSSAGARFSTNQNVDKDCNGDIGVTLLEVSTVNGGKTKQNNSTNQQSAIARKSTKRDKMIRMANLKTAAMLLVVTVVFIVTFLPAFLIMHRVIPYNMLVFYMYFANNVANPVIYSFMNKNFRDDLRKLFCSKRGN